MKRRPQNKARSAKTFRRNAGRTKAANLAPRTSRGGSRA